MEKKHAHPNPGVGCDVTACKYNTIDCRCTAEKISVQNENATALKGHALSKQGAAVCRSALASLARLQTEKCFLRGTRPRKKRIQFIFRLRAKNSARLFSLRRKGLT